MAPNADAAAARAAALQSAGPGAGVRAGNSGRGAGQPALPSRSPRRLARRRTAVHRSDPLLTDPDAGAQIEELLPSINEISLTGSQALPELHLDVHVYATKPSERFVYINMRKYHEGATLQEGPVLERIRRDGVVLNYQGLRFVLPRQP